MNRREAIAALVSLPGVAKISAAPVKPKDVIVVETSERFSRETAARLAHVLEQIWPGQKVLVLDQGMTLKVVEGA